MLTHFIVKRSPCLNVICGWESNIAKRSLQQPQCSFTLWYFILSVILFLAPANEIGEGYVFTRICLSFHRGGVPHVNITHDAQSHQDMGPPWPGPLLVTSGGHHWIPVQSCSFEDPHRYWNLVAEAGRIGKRTSRILLGCFLVFVVINGHQDTFLASKYRDKINDNFDVLFDVDLKVILPKLREKSQSLLLFFYFLLSD